MKHPSLTRARRASLAAYRLHAFNVYDLALGIATDNGVSLGELTSDLRLHGATNARHELVQALFIDRGWAPSAIFYVTGLGTRTIADALSKPARKAKAA